MGTGVYLNNICHEETAVRVEKPAPVPFCLIEIPFGLLWDGNRNFTFTSRWRISQWLLCDINFSTTYFHVHCFKYCNMCFNTRTSMTRVYVKNLEHWGCIYLIVVWLWTTACKVLAWRYTILSHLRMWQLYISNSVIWMIKTSLNSVF